MKLYTFDPAPNPKRLAMFLQYKGIALPTEQVDLMNRQQLTPEYQAINPQGTVPALVLDDGTALTEVIGICTYLEALYPDRPLLGTTPLEKAQVASWCHRLFVGLFHAIASVFRNRGRAFTNRALPGPLDLPQIPELVARGQQQIDHLLPILDAHLAQQPWVAGQHFSQADIDLLACVEFLGWIKAEVPAQCTHLLAWRERAAAQLA